MDVILRIFWGFLSTVLFGGLLGLGLAVASRKLKVEKDETVEALDGVLPGLNCGACGYAGCGGYAEALAAGKDEDLTKCKPGGAVALAGIGKILGVEVDTNAVRMVAYVHCLGKEGVASRSYNYEGLEDCNAATVLFSGDKDCKYGCLGLGSCMNVCPTNAIRKTGDGLVVVNPDLCISCGKCVDICPTGVMRMIPEDADFVVACNSRDKGKLTKSNCKVGCIACKICEKKFPEAGYKIQDNLSILGYDNRGPGRAEAVEKCPAKCIIPYREVKIEEASSAG
ncbi:RnfABCDGE type electron transport complex subunit B [Oceanispirochaeta crateris]|uniref:Ion-translocating oxidoreductase complex subunit B n=1 Tax=Oceanispirochaeta crateris TaxID=2518645 RepID=A0A5C1QIJ6_9SPIO|nr:RnfABCDGE type electron transport complex subunit B [Oceanispirochaeta crateris]QEN07973.1 RnfABCDGE type electron transport complex subunit B [Oceanispirochaeta crateris]